MSAREEVAGVLAEHILLGYGTCSCGRQYFGHGTYSQQHRAHLADALLASGWLADHAQVRAEERERVEALCDQAEAGEGIVLWPGLQTYYTVEVGLLRAALAEGSS